MASLQHREHAMLTLSSIHPAIAFDGRSFVKQALRPLIIALALIVGINGASGGPANDVLTAHNDIHRTGVYGVETRLNPGDVGPRRFGKVFSRRVLGQIWGQPLYVEGVPVAGHPHNVVYVATSENMVYGFDADDFSQDERTKPLAEVRLGDPSPVPSSDFGTIKPSNGISSTPVIDLGTPPDPARGTLYVVAKLNQDNNFHIFALDLGTLDIKPNAQGQKTGVIVSGSAPGQNRRGKTTISFSGDHLNRPALLISDHRLVVAFGSGPNNDSDAAGYHGWVISYSLPDLVQTGTFVTTPTTETGMGGIWQAGAGPAADDQGNIYVMTGNGHFQSAQGRLPDLTDSFIKLENKDGTLKLADWYTPPSRDVMEACDLHLGASGPGIIEDAGRVVGAGKSGILYVLNKDAMGKTDAPFDLTAAGQWRGEPDCKSGQCFRVAENQHHQMNTKQACNMQGFPFGGAGFNSSNWNVALDSYPHVHGPPVIWKKGSNDFNLYVWLEVDDLKAYHFDGQSFATAPVGSSRPVSAADMSMPGGVLSLSWNGKNTSSAIIWASRPNPEGANAVGGPFVDTYIGHDQQHFAYRTADGGIWDAFYCPQCSGDDKWHLQQINCGQASPCAGKNPDAVSAGPAAGDGPFVDTYAEHDQQHFAYLDRRGGIWDAFYCPGCSGSQWRLQQINNTGHGGATNGPAAVAAPFVNVFSGHDQQHFAYRTADGAIWDAFFCAGCNGGQWLLQQINCGNNSSCANKNPSAVSDGPAAGAGPFIDTYAEDDQQHFAYLDGSGGIWDAFYCPACSGNPWRLQQINDTGHGGATNGPAAAAAPFVNEYSGHDQQHFAYRTTDGAIWDAFYCAGCNGGQWRLQQINCGNNSPCANKNPGAVSDGPAATDGPFIDTSAEHDQQHFAYRAADGGIWDAFFCPGCSGDQWRLQQINNTGHGGATNGPAAVAAPFVNVYSGNDQQHFAYRVAGGAIWDAFYCAGCNGGEWLLQRLLQTLCMMMASMDDLTPNDAPCNAINKIVHGYLQAFEAMPGRDGRLRPLWNSEQNPNDAIEWFAKESPPTIADGKVFVAEFPPKPSDEFWNAANASGRLIVYSLR
jgi:hypothetical protein